jgi:uncharacterized protein with ParB-like and HNH nuclease domain
MNYPNTPDPIRSPEDFNDHSEIDLEEDESIVQPFDSAKIRVETKTMSIDLLLDRIRYDELNLAPDFQRQGGLWKLSLKSRLIESMLIRIPLPAFYMDATDEDKWTVIDGLQRLSTIKSFVIDKKLRLEGLEFLDQLEGKNYDELPRNFQRRILETQVTVYLIEKGTPPEVKFNIFKRINTGGLPLTSQEIRHALHQGKATKLLEELASSQDFLAVTQHKIPRERMIDREFVLRFLAFMITPIEDYKSAEFDSFLSEIMGKINHMTEAEIKSLEMSFSHAMKSSFDIFDENAFRKVYSYDDRKYPINKALFESWSVNLAHISQSDIETLKEKKHLLRSSFAQLMNYSDFRNSISQGTGDSRKVAIRFNAISILINYCLSEIHCNKESLSAKLSEIMSMDLHGEAMLAEAIEAAEKCIEESLEQDAMIEKALKEARRHLESES